MSVAGEYSGTTEIEPRDPVQPIQTGRSRDHSLDALKGVLICLVCMGHVHALSQQHPGVVRFFYLFHIPLFLAISCAMVSVRDHRALLQFARRRAVQLVIPFASWLIVYSVLATLFGRTPCDSLGSWLSHLALAFGIGNIEAIRAATDTAVLWFLPCLFSTNVLYALIRSTGIRDRACLALATAMLCIAYPFLGYQSHDSVPWGLDVAVYTMPLCFAIAAIYAIKLFRGTCWVIVGTVAALSIGYALQSASVSRGLQSMILPDRPWKGILCDLLCVALFISTHGTLDLLSKHRAVRPLVELLANAGRHSFSIYVTHPFVFAAVRPDSILRRLSLPDSIEVGGVAVLMTVLAIGFGLMLSRIANYLPKVALLAGISSGEPRQTRPGRILTRRLARRSALGYTPGVD